MGAFGWPHLLIILAVILLLFGAAKLPALAKSMGQSARVFRGEMKAMKDDDRPSADGGETPTTDAAGSTPAAHSSGEPKP
nr:twin-arginine translocase TatA/TatE family subunit [Microbacterium bovistercoris]